MRYITTLTRAIGKWDHSFTRRICAKLHDMSTSTSGAEWAGILLEDAIAAVLMNEMADQRYTATEIQKRAGVKARSWGNYYVNRSREIPTTVWVATGEALGLDPVEVVRRARVLATSLSDGQAELLADMGGRTRVQMLRDIAREPGRRPGVNVEKILEDSPHLAEVRERGRRLTAERTTGE